VERLVAWYTVGSSIGAVVALVVANAIPLVGVLFLGWDVWTILIVYWLENGIVGIFNVAKMWLAEGVDDASAQTRINGRPIQGQAKGFLIPFFLVHYGIFWVVHGVFVFSLPAFASFGSDAASMTFDPGAIAFAAFALFIGHGASFLFNYVGRGEYRHVSAAGQMFAPYGRLVILHLTILLGAFAITFVGAPVAAVAVLVALKTAMDLGFHLREHRNVAPRPSAPVAAA
jgi:Family of unknown function (DUF6498)